MEKEVGQGIPEDLLKYLRKKFPNHESFLETGTHAGWTVDKAIRYYRQVLSVELSTLHYGRAAERYKYDERVKLYQGSSRQLMGRMLDDLAGPAVIWLDAHYSAGDTASDGEGMECPVREELAAIKAAGYWNHVILIDDMRDFLGGVYPTQTELREMLKDINPQYEIEILDQRHGIMIAEPILNFTH